MFGPFKYLSYVLFSSVWSISIQSPPGLNIAYMEHKWKRIFWGLNILDGIFAHTEGFDEDTGHTSER